MHSASHASAILFTVLFVLPCPTYHICLYPFCIQQAMGLQILPPFVPTDTEHVDAFIQFHARSAEDLNMLTLAELCLASLLSFE